MQCNLLRELFNILRWQGMSTEKRAKSNGETVKPWGTPEAISRVPERSFPTLIPKVPSERYDKITLMRKL